ncbi:hypothetical protein ZWY2020_022186 [Hordeum vulgare]|nr:hypothetical protein ZWY2020_022186 [Hordeum vulgare]
MSSLGAFIPSSYRDRSSPSASYHSYLPPHSRLELMGDGNQGPDPVALPVVPCPDCGRTVVTYVARHGQHVGERFYKCRNHNPGRGGCNFYRWQGKYAEHLATLGAEAPLLGQINSGQEGNAPVNQGGHLQAVEEAVGHQIGAKHGRTGHPWQVMLEDLRSGIHRQLCGTTPAAGPKAAASPSYTLGVKLMEEDDERGCLEGGRQDSTVYCDGVPQASKDPEDQTALTSRLSVKHVVEVMQKFDEYKRWLVSEIGFEGMLNLPRLGKIDLRMSAWIMRKVKVKSRTIVIDKERVLLFAPEDFHKIFGVPCGNRVVRGRDGEINNTTIEFMKQTIGMNASPAHNLKAAENFITRDISEESSKIEKDCFQISFVIFVMGYVLSPSTKHEYMTIDFWGALANLN